jgi:2-desacetyl-2-hydroxyethyl bacteriochlorophyllide A dehydrogenase
MERTTIHFVGPRRIELRGEPVVAPGADQVLVQTQLSAVSAGTEMLLFRGEIPEAADSEADTISRGLSYPTTYGYCAVGQVVQAGSSIERGWLGREVFAFQPHSSHFAVTPSALVQVPDGMTAEAAVFLPSAETAVNLVQDAAPILGERVLVLGQGVVGLLSAALLHEFPLECLVTADRYAGRRQASERLGVTAALDPADPDFKEKALSHTGSGFTGYDAVVELTGNPSALDDAIALTTFSGRVVVGSWFGSKKASLDLGGRYHRSRIRIVASQVSTIAPELGGRWDKRRRFAVAWEAIKRIGPRRWITHRFPIERAADAYRLLDESPEASIQIVLEYR